MPFIASKDYPRWADVASLIHTAFAYMTPVLGHPARAMSITATNLETAAQHGTAHLIEAEKAPIACVFTRPSRDMADALYLGWLAVGAAFRGKGLAQTLIAAAETEARTQGFAAVTLDTGRALTDLHAFFSQAGFAAIPGTGPIITFRKSL